MDENGNNPKQSWIGWVWKRLSLFGPILVVISLLDKVDVFINFHEFADEFLNSWQVWTAKIWGILFGLFGVERVTAIDAVFFTFITVLAILIFTSFTRKKIRTDFSGLGSVLFGLIVISLIFTVADLQAYEANRNSLENSFQYSIYKFYEDFIGVHNIPASKYSDVIILSVACFYYLIVSIVVLAICGLLSRLIGCRVHI